MSVDGFLRSVPSDVDADDGRLYDPTVADSGGVQNIVDAGGIAGAEAIGAPGLAVAIDGGSVPSGEALGQPGISLGAVPEAVSPPAPVGGALPLRRPRPRPGPGEFVYLVPHVVRGAGAIPSEEAFGLPAISAVPSIRARSVREKEWLELRRAA